MNLCNRDLFPSRRRLRDSKTEGRFVCHVFPQDKQSVPLSCVAEGYENTGIYKYFQYI